MDSTAFKLIKALSSDTRMKIISCILEGMDHPDDIAKHLGLKRQSVDKHLLLLYDLRLLDRSAVFPPGRRPRIVYRMSDAGKGLLDDIEEVGKRYRERLNTMYRSEKRVLDMALADGEISEEVYLKNIASLKEKYDIR